MNKKILISLLIVVLLNIGHANAQNFIKSHYPFDNDVVDSESLNNRISIHLEPGYSLTGYIKPKIINPDGRDVYQTYGVSDVTKIDNLIETTGLEAILYSNFDIPGKYKVVFTKGSISDSNGPLNNDEYVFFFTVEGNISLDEYLIFDDVPVGFWARDSIENLYRMNKISGYPDGSFRPNNFVTRAELAALIYNVMPFGDNERILLDVNYNDWSYSAIQATIDFIPTEDELWFKPNEFATREDVITAFIKAGMSEYDLYTTMDMCSEFADHNEINPEKHEYLNNAVNIGLISGYEDNTLRPKDNITRAEIAAIFYKFIYMFS